MLEGDLLAGRRSALRHGLGTALLVLLIPAAGACHREPPPERVVYVVAGDEDPQAERREAERRAAADHERAAARCRDRCTRSEMQCRRGCEPREWSENMMDQQRYCEQQCDFDGFACESDCRRE